MNRSLIATATSTPTAPSLQWRGCFQCGMSLGTNAPQFTVPAHWHSIFCNAFRAAFRNSRPPIVTSKEPIVAIPRGWLRVVQQWRSLTSRYGLSPAASALTPRSSRNTFA